MQQIDMAILNWIQAHLTGGFLTQVLRVVTYFGEFGAGWILIALILLCRKKTRRAGLTMGAALLLGLVFGELLLKNLIQRPRPFMLRPEVSLLIFEPFGYSFPSGHATSSFAAAVSLFFFNRRLGAAALTLAVLIAFSRMYFFVHFLTDVLFGAALGTGCAFLARFLIQRAAQRGSAGRAGPAGGREGL